MAAAAEAVPAILPHLPVALEGLDSRLVEVVRSRRGPAAVPDLPRGGGWLFVETAGDTPDEARDAARKLVADGGCLDSAVITGPRAAALWRIREDGAGLGSRTPAGAPAWPGWEDSAVPPDRLAPYLRELTALMTAHGLDGLMYGHFGDGCIHVRIDFPLRDRPAVLRSFMEEAARLAASYGGSASGEHGDGRARGELLPTMYSAEAIGIFGAVKHLFDPGNLLNPGVIVDPAPLDADLRVPAAPPLRRGLGFAYHGDRGDFSTAVHRCVGVGKCRADNTASGGVMCPSYLATRDEKDSTRGRARVLQELANGSLVSSGWRSPEVAEALDLCLSCKGCSTDCPTGVDMATYKAEVLYQRYRGRLRPATHYSLGWLPRWAALTARVPWASTLANGALRMGFIAALAKRLGGMDARRPVPEFARRSFRRWFAERTAVGTGAAAVGTGAADAGRAAGDAPGGRKPVLLWVDTFANAFAPQVAVAAVKVLESAGYEVRVTERNVCCGLTWISTGQLDGARRQLRRTLRELGPALDEGIPVVGLEPSCTAVLRQDAAELLPGDPRAQRLGSAVKTLAELLRATDGWTPPDLSDVTGVAQPHCHQHAVLGWDADAALLASAGARVDPVGGCCGLAGNFGVERGHYDVSVAVAETALLPAVRAAVRAAGDNATTVLADGFSCRTQLDQLADVHGTHLAELLAARLRLAEDHRGGLALHEVVDDRRAGRNGGRDRVDADRRGPEDVHAARAEQVVDDQRGGAAQSGLNERERRVAADGVGGGGPERVVPRRAVARHRERPAPPGQRLDPRDERRRGGGGAELVDQLAVHLLRAGQAHGRHRRLAPSGLAKLLDEHGAGDRGQVVRRHRGDHRPARGDRARRGRGEPGGEVGRGEQHRLQGRAGQLSSGGGQRRHGRGGLRGGRGRRGPRGGRGRRRRRGRLVRDSLGRAAGDGDERRGENREGRTYTAHAASYTS